MSMFEPVHQVHCLLQLSSSCFSGILQSSCLDCPIPMDFGCSAFDSSFSCSCGLCFIESLADSLSGWERPSYWFEWESFHAFDHWLHRCFQVGRSRRLLLRLLALLVLMTSHFVDNSANCQSSLLNSSSNSLLDHSTWPYRLRWLPHADLQMHYYRYYCLLN
jgi:hypothetical protein